MNKIVKEVKNIDLDRKLIVVLIIVLCYLSIATISAADDNLTVADDSSNCILKISQENITDITESPQEILGSGLEEDVPDVPDLNVVEKSYVYPSNINQYFPYGTLDKKYEGKTLVFSGNFENLGILTIKRDSVTIIGSNATLKNTVFDVSANDVTLKSLNFDLDRNFRENSGAAILVAGYDVTLDDLYINYIVPNDVEAYAIYSDGNRYSSLNLKIVNCDIYFEGHNDNLEKYNCAVKLTDVDEGLMENNTIMTSLPLKNVKYGLFGATLDSDFVYSVGVENCNGFVFNNNTVISNVNKRTAVLYPTLNCIMVSKSDDVMISNNSVYMTDFVTYPGVESFIYGIDIYNVNNLTIIRNKVSIISTGGKLALGTAYPIQICGPITQVKVTENDLYSFSNGPNIGIYSQNYYGETELSITNNRINVTGLAGVHEWALVTGIESQDTNAEIINNTIEVHSVGVVNVGDNLYAISYRQSTANEHTFNIQNNTAFTDGFYGVYLLSSDNSIIVGNTLISYNENAVSGSDAYKRGPRTHYGDQAYDNVVLTIRDYLNSQNNIDVDPNSDSNRGSSNIIDAGSYSSSDSTTQRNYNNPLIPHYSNSLPVNNNAGGSTGLIDNFVDDGSAQGTIGDYKGFNHDQSDSEVKNTNTNTNNNYRKSHIDSSNVNTTDIKGASANAVSNSSDATPSIDGDSSTPLGKSQSSSDSSESQSVSKKAFELEEMNDSEDFIPSIFFIVLAIILLVVGFKRKNTNLE
ncbi:MAG: hypothetical protein IKE95_00410 [Methanobrevibacter sp.]|nr:hypothetical protein [Methanobrevibacter sp.]